MVSMPSHRFTTARLPALPNRLAGKGGSSVFVVLALLAIAIFFYVRAVAPPAEAPASAKAGGDSAAPLPGNPATVALPPVAAAGEGAPARASLDPKLVDALSGVMKPTGEPPQGAAAEAAETETETEAAAETETAAARASQAAAAEAPVAAPEPAEAPQPRPGLQPVPTAQLDLLKDVFAPEIQ
jgi:hypothetical protein